MQTRWFTLPIKQRIELLDFQSFYDVRWLIKTRKNFRTAPNIYYACRLINYACASLSYETTANTLRYCIYALIIITYCANKRGFRCARFFFSFSPFPCYVLPSSSFPSTPLFGTPAFSRPFFFLFLFLFPRQASNLYPSITPGLQVQHLYHYTTRFS